MIQSYPFWLLLAVTVPLFWILPAQLRMAALGSISVVYIASIDPVSTLWLGGWSATFYLLTARLEPSAGSKSHARILILAVLSVLMAYKYLGPLIAKALDQSPASIFLVPLGMSYYTFKLIHYAVETNRGNIGNNSFSTFACYLFLFPIFTAGPIERFDHFLANKNDLWNGEMVIDGLTRIGYGLIKKGFVVGLLLTPLYGSVDTPDRVLMWLDSLSAWRVWYFVLLSFTISYLDFSAYSDIAIGASRLFGLKIAENFNFPFLAADLTEFWRRWHMTLVGWLQAYVYMPLIGLTRNVTLSIFTTFVAIGLWHAGTLNWLCWGLFHAAGIVVQSRWTRMRRRRGWAICKTKSWHVLCVVITWCYAGFGYLFVVMDGNGFSATMATLAAMLGLRI